VTSSKAGINDANRKDRKDLEGSLISQLAPLMNDATNQGHIQPLSTDFEVFEVFAVCIFLLG
jgi:hypothetical protein